MSFRNFIAMFLALSIYTGTYIAEAVRAGIMAVSHGQSEASYALGLRPGKALRLVVIPQAMRVVIPPLAIDLSQPHQELVARGGHRLSRPGGNWRRRC